MINELKSAFYQKYNTQPLIVKSPGRINFIGEHVDYNNGLVLPAAINKYILAAVSKRKDEEIHLHSIAFNQSYNTQLNHLKNSINIKWPVYVLGVVNQLIKNNYSISGFNLMIDGNLNIGAGLSSSAAIACSVIFALNELFELHLSKMQMVIFSQKAEQEFAGVNCGVMDMFASMFGKQNNVIKLNCKSLQYSYIPINSKKIKIVLFDSGVKHSLATSEYNLRRIQCEQGVLWIKENEPLVNTLNEVTYEMLNKYVLPKNKIIFNRCKYVVDEIKRVQMACLDLENNNLVALGKKMFETHEGLKNLYEVSCPELDFLVNQVKNNENVLGARLMGGGFGGCTINLVKENVDTQFIHTIQTNYLKNMNKNLQAYIVTIEDGTTCIL